MGIRSKVKAFLLRLFYGGSRDADLVSEFNAKVESLEGEKRQLRNCQSRWIAMCGRLSGENKGLRYEVERLREELHDVLCLKNHWQIVSHDQDLALTLSVEVLDILVARQRSYEKRLWEIRADRDAAYEKLAAQPLLELFANMIAIWNPLSLTRREYKPDVG